MPKTLLEGELFFLSVSVDLISAAVYSKQRLIDLSMVISTDNSILGVDQYVFFRADTDYYRSSRPITDILNRYTCLV